ncbi:Long-chain-fatty-acid--CoA ligase FadD15 (plasmid) [Variovorax sp. SRS16]|uniref:AMP-dependent synthetase/ligase n=1 Tax=Variovorax sp. SRS16 TaxID=282217 RepID=UPI001316584D|nr:AMP-binding protein [Variovorax sp. SRS16]VTU45528.1 Long-chain-fatty-acid--CoA ligase FadD15 [Variovorax sp. SRS16]
MIHLWNLARAEHAARTATLQPGETLPAVFFGAAGSRAEQVFMRAKQLGVWASVTWSEAGRAVREAAAGLRALGVERGQVVCIVSHTRQECILADLAIMTIGAVSAAMSPGLTRDMAGLCGRIGAVLAFVEDEEQLDRLRDGEGRLPAGLRVVMLRSTVADDQGLRADSDRSTSWEALRALGREAASTMPAVALSPEAPAILSCSAGTTGAPEFVVHSHRAVLETCRALQQRVPYTAQDSKLCFMSWARANERLLSVYLPILAGTCISFAEGLDTVPENLREVSPTLLSATPRHLEKLRAEVGSAAEEAGRIPRAAFEWALACGAEVARKVLRNEAPGPALRLKCALGRTFILNNVRRFMGLDRCRHLIVVDATLPQALAEWYFAMGIPVVQVWGTTQTLGIATVNALPDFRPGFVGKALSVATVAIDPRSGELLASGVFASEPAPIRTGDLGRIDADGFVEVTGRVSERMAAASGDPIPASRIQQLLRESPYVQDALVFGEGRAYPSAVILLARDKVEHHAQQVGVSFPDFSGLTQAAEVRALLQSQIDRANEQLEAAHRVRRFHLIEVDLEPGDEEMTPTRMLRRWTVETRYRQHIESMYA